jgi:LPXTG-motif cell wall-anchored protein
MLRLRLAVAGILTVGLLALAVPAASLAGGSAGDQQYTDPFSGSSSHTATARASATTTSSPAPSTTTAPAASAPDPTTANAASTTADATTTADEPTATIATSSPMLPHTGYDAWTAVGFGIVLIGGGIALRRRVRGYRA